MLFAALGAACAGMFAGCGDEPAQPDAGATPAAAASSPAAAAGTPRSPIPSAPAMTLEAQDFIALAGEVLGIGDLPATELAPTQVSPAQSTTSAAPILAVGPLINLTGAPLEQSELLREYFRILIEEMLRSQGAATVAHAAVDAAYAGRIRDDEPSVSDATLVELARSAGAPWLLAAEIGQEANGMAILRARLVSTDAGAVVRRDDYPTSSTPASYQGMLRLCGANAPSAAAAALEKITGDPTSADALRDPATAPEYAKQAERYALLAAELSAPTRLKKLLAARASACARLCEWNDPGFAGSRTGRALAFWAVGMQSATLEEIKADEAAGATPPHMAALRAALRRDDPGPAPAGGWAPAMQSVGDALTHRAALRLKAAQLAAWWRDAEAVGLLMESALKDPDVDSAALVEAALSLPFGAERQQIAGRALLAATRNWLKSALEARRRMGARITAELEQAGRAFAAMGIDAWNPESSSPEIPSAAALRGEGPLAELLRLAAQLDADRVAQDFIATDGEELQWGVDFHREKCADAWLSAWEAAQPDLAGKEDAGRALAFAAEMFPRNAVVLTAAAQHWGEGGEFERRDAALRAALESDPRYAPAVRLAVRLREFQLTPAEAAAAYEDARALDPFNTQLIQWAAENMARLRTIQPAERLYRAAQALDPFGFEAYVARLNMMREIQHREVPRNLIAQLFTDFPPSPALQLAAAELYFENGDGERAESIARNLAGRYPGRFEAGYLLARIQAYAGRLDEAIATLEDAATAPRTKAQETDAAQLRMILDGRRSGVDTPTPDAAPYWNMVRQAVGQDPAAAREQADRLVAEGPRRPWAHWAKAEILRQLGEYDAAAAAADAGLSLRQTAAERELLCALAEAFLDSDKPLAARAALEALEVAYFDDPEAMRVVARGARMRGEIDKAEDALRVARRMAPADTRLIDPMP